MICPCAHEWYEVERGEAPREEAERLRRHLAECDACRAQADSIRDVAAALERWADQSRVDLPQEAARSLVRRARVHGLLGRPIQTPLSVRMARVRWSRVILATAAAMAAAVILSIGLPMFLPADIQPQGALNRLAWASHGLRQAEALRPLAPIARAAVSEELARPDASPDQVADLLMVSYIAQQPREDRQVVDVNFLLDGIWARRHPPGGSTAMRTVAGPMLASVALAQAAASAAPSPPGDRTLTGDCTADVSPLAVARTHLLAGDYEAALAVIPKDGSGAELRAWCLQAIGRTTEAAQALAAAGRDETPMTCVLRADLALGAKDVAEAMRQYEQLATQRDRYWFNAGYLCRYELRDPRSAGLRFERVRDPRMANYVTEAFAMELASVRVPAPAPLLTEDFESDDAGAPPPWALVRTRGGEFRVVEVPSGKALQQNEIQCRGAEFLCGGPDWADYTLQADVKVLAYQGDYAVGAAVYRRADHTGYVLEWSPHDLRIVKQFASRQEARKAGGPAEQLLLAPMQAQTRLDEPPALGWWYTLKIRAQRVDGGVNVAGKVWRSDLPEPLGWQVVWTDAGQAGVGPLAGGAAGLQIDGARVQVDNLSVTHNEASRELQAAAGP